MTKLYMEHKTNQRVIISFNQALRSLCKVWTKIFTEKEANTRDDREVDLPSVGYCELLVLSLRDHVDSRELCLLALSSFLLLCEMNEQNMKCLIARGGMSALVHVINSHILDIDVCLRSSEALYFVARCLNKVSISPDDNKSVCIAVCNILRNSSANCMIAKLCCRIVHCMTSVPGNNELDVVNREIFGSNGACEQLIIVLKQFKDDRDVGMAVSLTIDSLCENSSTNLAKMSTDVSFLSAVAIFVQRSLGDVDALCAACRAVRMLSLHEANKELLGKYGICGHLSASFSSNMSQEGSEKYLVLCAAIFALSFENIANANLFGLSKTCENILTTVSYFSDNVEVVEMGLCALGSLCFSPVNIPLVGTEGCDFACKMLDRYSSSMGVVRACLVLISSLSMDGGDMSRFFKSSRIGMHLPEIAKCSINNIHMVEICLSAMVSLCTGYESSTNFASSTSSVEHNENDISSMEELISGGVVEIVIDILMSYTRAPVIMSHTATIITHLMTNVHARDLLTTNDCIYRNIMIALQMHISVKGVNKALCSCVRALSESDHGRAELEQAGACPLIVEALHISVAVKDGELMVEVLETVVSMCHEGLLNQEKFGSIGICTDIHDILKDTKNPTAQASTLKAIAMLCDGGHAESLKSIKNAIRFGKIGTCQLVVNVLLTDSANFDVFAAAGLAISGLSLREQNITEMVSCGACEALNTVAQKHMRSEKTCQHISGALYELTVEFTVARQLKLKVAETMFLMAQRFPDNLIICWNAVSMVHRMILVSPIARNTLCRVDILEAIVGMLRNMVSSERLVAVALSVLIKSCEINEETKTLLGRFGACEVITAALRTHILIPSLAAQCRDCLKQLAFGNDANLERVNNAGGFDLLDQMKTLTQNVWKPANEME